MEPAIYAKVGIFLDLWYAYCILSSLLKTHLSNTKLHGLVKLKNEKLNISIQPLNITLITSNPLHLKV